MMPNQYINQELRCSQPPGQIRLITAMVQFLHCICNTSALLSFLSCLPAFHILHIAIQLSQEEIERERDLEPGRCTRMQLRNPTMEHSILGKTLLSAVVHALAPSPHIFCLAISLSHSLCNNWIVIWVGEETTTSDAFINSEDLQGLQGMIWDQEDCYQPLSYEWM